MRKKLWCSYLSFSILHEFFEKDFILSVSYSDLIKMTLHKGSDFVVKLFVANNFGKFFGYKLLCFFEQYAIPIFGN